MKILFCILCAILAAAFIYVEHKEKYVPAVILKGLASLMFVLLGITTSKLCSDVYFAKWIMIGLVLGCIADILLNLRFVFEKAGQKIFLVGILVFLAGHVMYLIALIPSADKIWIWLAIGVVATFGLLKWIFSQITAKKAFKIFGVFYIGAITLMVCTSIGVLVTAYSTAALIFTLGSLLFLASDIVLILNTFGSETKFSLRITNLSLYYIAQLLIGLSMIVK